MCGLTIRSSGPLRRVALLSGRGQQRPLNSSVRPHKRFLFNARSLRHVGFCSLAAAASLLAWLARAAVHVSGWPVFRSSRATQRCTMRFMRARSLRYARGYSSVQQCSASARLFQAQATTSSAVCQAGFALFRRCGLTIRSSGLPMSVCAKIMRRRRQPLNSSVRHHGGVRSKDCGN